MNKYIAIIALILSACLIALGFNTLDWMTQRNQEPMWYFMYPMKFGMPFWYAYFFGGILPLASGGFLLGILSGWVLKARKHREHNGGLKIKFSLDPTVPRVMIIGLLLFIEGLLVPAYSLLQNGQMPTATQWFTFFIGAILQLVTYLLAFMGYKKEETT